MALLVKRVVNAEDSQPGKNAMRVDAMVDFLLYFVLPAVGLVSMGLLVKPLGWLAALPILSGIHRFDKTSGKRIDVILWPFTLFYLFFLPLSQLAVAGVLLAVTAFIFLKVNQPSVSIWRGRKTAIVSVMWLSVVLATLLHPEAETSAAVAWRSLLYPMTIVVFARMQSLENLKVLPKHKQALEVAVKK
jgi:hypothetical protein